MKKLVLLAFAFFSFVAQASDMHIGLDQVAFNVKFEVQVCVNGECALQSTAGENFFLNLSFADWIDDAVVTKAYWTQVIWLDGINFATDIKVVRTSTKDGDSYDFESHVGPVESYAQSAFVTVSMGTAKTLPTPVYMEGPSITKGNVVYTPRVLIQAPFFEG